VRGAGTAGAAEEGFGTHVDKARVRRRLMAVPKTEFFERRTVRRGFPRDVSSAAPPLLHRPPCRVLPGGFVLAAPVLRPRGRMSGSSGQNAWAPAGLKCPLTSVLFPHFKSKSPSALGNSSVEKAAWQDGALRTTLFEPFEILRHSNLRKMPRC